MNELAINRFAISPTFSERFFGTRETRQGSAFYGYSLTLLALGVGWLVGSVTVRSTNTSDQRRFDISAIVTPPRATAVRPRPHRGNRPGVR